MCLSELERGQSGAEEHLLSCESADTKRQAFGLLIDSSSQDGLTCLSPSLVSIVRGDLVCLQISMQAKTANRVLLAICLALTCVASVDQLSHLDSGSRY